jgi:hypothetical protein
LFETVKEKEVVKEERRRKKRFAYPTRNAKELGMVPLNHVVIVYELTTSLAGISIHKKNEEWPTGQLRDGLISTWCSLLYAKAMLSYLPFPPIPPVLIHISQLPQGQANTSHEILKIWRPIPLLPTFDLAVSPPFVVS